MKNVEVQIKYECSYCEGVGVVQGYEWKEFWEQPNAKDMTNEETEQWFEERGYMHWSSYQCGQRVRLFPEEEVPCNECEGSKVLYRWVPVESILPRQLTSDGMGVITR